MTLAQKIPALILMETQQLRDGMNPAEDNGGKEAMHNTK